VAPHQIHLGGRTIFVGGVWTQLTSANQVYTVDAVTQSSGSDAVFAEDFIGNGRLEVYSQGTWTNITGFSDADLSFSAGLDSHGNAEVWYQLIENYSGFLGIGGTHTYGFYSWTAATGAQTYIYLGNDAPRYAPTLTATDDGQCYFFQPDFSGSPSAVSGALKLYDSQTTDTVVLEVLNSNTQVSAAGAGDVYLISNTNYLGEATFAANGAELNINTWYID
jgi:hypothetical protein